VTRPPAGTRLTVREREIANLLGLGLTNKEIAARLKISQRTADTHVQNMLNKLGASNRAQIVALAGMDAPLLAAEVTLAAPPGLQAVHRLSIRRPPRLVGFVAGAAVIALMMSADHQTTFVPAATLTASAGTTDREIVDPFNGTDVDSSIWDVGSSQMVLISEGNGHLGVYVATSAPQMFSGGVNTVCRASGDFDARVSFELVTWPREDGVWVSLLAGNNGFNAYRVSAFGGESYGAYLPPGGRTVKATGTAGTLRLSRSGSRWSGYFWLDGRWSWIASADGPLDDVGVAVRVFNGDAWRFGGHEALVYFTNFHLTASRIVCS
jgi:DNA-binding CsgD family transcriptional regulator